MKLAKFNTKEEAEAKMEELSDLARSENSPATFKLTRINESTDGSFYWFIFGEDCLKHAGLALAQIQQKESELDILITDDIPLEYHTPQTIEGE